ncbi:MAG: NPCBM/NEW2 domain-containing protein [Planctomycetes bacterium]|nr:NPCBM/NEW2 domain-containing protein [Planctomycetota bacterium]
MILASVLLLVSMAAPQAAQKIQLSELDLSLVQQGWGSAHADLSVEGKALSIGSREFDHGVGTHADSVIHLALNGKGNQFQSWVGVDAETNDKGSVRFRIIGDGELLFDSAIMRGGDEAKRVDLDLLGCQKLLLWVDGGGDGISYDHADWADAHFTFTGAAPSIVAAPTEAKVIRTPVPGPAPRLNGPRTYGVRPGKPFLYRIPVTGARPLEFSAHGLPESIVLDADDAMLIGNAPLQSGEYCVTLQAKNKGGTDQREFRIVVGDTLALTPPMGWNSWYIHYDRITQKGMEAAAESMVASGMADVGYQYVNIDDCWMVKPGSDDPLENGQARDQSGAVLANGKFPDMKGMVDFIHDLGLKAGTYISPGEITCAGYVGSLAHEAVDARRFAEWGFDFLKYDWCSYGRVAKDGSLAELRKPYDLMGELLRQQDRDILMNLCQYGMGDVWKWGGDTGGHCWRTTGDLGLGSQDPFQAVLGIGLRNAKLHEYAQPGRWNDPDYLLLGWVGSAFTMGEGKPTSMSGNEQYSTMSLWSMMAAPLFFSGDMSKLDAFTLNVLCNPEVIDVDQDPLGKQGRIVRMQDDALLMVKPMEDGSVAVALFNLAEYERELGFQPEELGLSGTQRMRDLWLQKDLADLKGEYRIRLARHDVGMWRLWPQPKAANSSIINMSGSWEFAIDSADHGLTEEWWNREFQNRIGLPGSLQMQGFGEAPSATTEWTGSIVDRSWYEAEAYANYRQPGSEKFPFWLQPRRHYVGPAWYKKEVEIPASWAGKHVELYLERCHWTTTLWLDGTQIGKRDSLSTPHVYVLPQALYPGKHQLTLRVDNRLAHEVGVNAHSVSDHTQTNWNGIIGDIHLRTKDALRIVDAQVYSDVDQRQARVVVTIANTSANARTCSLHLDAVAESRQWQHDPPAMEVPFVIGAGQQRIMHVAYPLGGNALLWDEFRPALYDMQLSLQASGEKASGEKGSGEKGNAETTNVAPSDFDYQLRFGLRKPATDGTRFTLNDRAIMLRGTLECSIFPLTGFPPTDQRAWRKIFQRCKEFGLNHVRFHSWCPPEAAFDAADEIGIYLQPEGPFWTHVGAGGELDEYIRAECDRILNTYGNHPSFTFFAYGNEPEVRDGGAFFSSLVSHWKQIDRRHLYASASGWGAVPESDYEVTFQPRMHHWGHGLASRINALPPATTANYQEFVNARSRPVVSHEIGQWCVFPDFNEISLYQGLLQARNFEIFADCLTKNGMGDQADDFLMASGFQQLLCYKEEIESALRTPGFGGFQLLDLHDFPGQGTALVGVLDPFWNPKPYVDAKTFKQFCGPLVPLAHLPKRIFTSDETLIAEIKIANYGRSRIPAALTHWRLKSSSGFLHAKGWLNHCDLALGDLTSVGNIHFPLSSLDAPGRYTLEVSIEGQPAQNEWDVWVYPPVATAEAPQVHLTPEVHLTPQVHVTQKFDSTAQEVLHAGGRVMLLAPPFSVKTDVAIGFSSVFWNTSWTRDQPPHTLGFLIQAEHASLADFPTQSHADWQWWDLIHGAKAMELTEFSAQLRPIVQPIHTWFENKRLALLFEAKVGKGQLLVSSMDLSTDLASRPVARQMRQSLLKYVSSETFAPTLEVTQQQIANLFRPIPTLLQIVASLHADTAHHSHPVANAADGNAATIWHSAWGKDAKPHPHHLVIDLGQPREVTGITYLPRQDMENGRVFEYAIYPSNHRDGLPTSPPIISGSWPNTAAKQILRFPKPVHTRYLILAAKSEVNQQGYTSVAELDVLLD